MPITDNGTDCKLSANESAATPPAVDSDAIPIKTNRRNWCAPSANDRGTDGNATSANDFLKDGNDKRNRCLLPISGNACAAKCRNAPNTTPHAKPSKPRFG